MIDISPAVAVQGSGNPCARASQIHHLGVVVKQINSETVAGLLSAVDGTWDEAIFDDPYQSVRVTFLRPTASAIPAVELVEPCGPASPVYSFLRRGGGLHHLCFEVPDLDACLAQYPTSSARIVRPPYPAVAFEGRPIAWVYQRHGLLIEYLASEASESCVTSDKAVAVPAR